MSFYFQPPVFAVRPPALVSSAVHPARRLAMPPPVPVVYSYAPAMHALSYAPIPPTVVHLPTSPFAAPPAQRRLAIRIVYHGRRAAPRAVDDAAVAELDGVLRAEGEAGARSVFLVVDVGGDGGGDGQADEGARVVEVGAAQDGHPAAPAEAAPAEPAPEEAQVNGDEEPRADGEPAPERGLDPVQEIHVDAADA